jgi:uncharacterized membrane protein
MLPDGNAMVLRKKRRDEPLLVTSRIWEIDFLRGLSIVLMLLYHGGFDITELAGKHTVFGIRWNLGSPGFQVAVALFAGLFILLCGISSTLTRSNVRRGLMLLGVAALVTIASFFFNREEVIYFGILHCLGACILIYGWTLEKTGPWLIAAVGLGVFGLSLVLPAVLGRTPIRFNWLAPIGIVSDTFSSYDYFPLLPWFGVFLAGAAIGKRLYADRRSLIKIDMPVGLLNIAGRHTLLIYVVHQPIFLAILYLAGWLK